MEPEVSQKLDKLFKDLKEKISQHPDLQHIDPSSLSLRIKLKVKPQPQGQGFAPRTVHCPSGCWDCNSAGECVCVPC